MKTIKISITVQFLLEIIQYRTQQIVIFKVLKEKKNAYIGSMQDTGCLGLVHWDDPEG